MSAHRTLLVLAVVAIALQGVSAGVRPGVALAPAARPSRQLEVRARGHGASTCADPPPPLQSAVEPPTAERQLHDEALQASPGAGLLPTSPTAFVLELKSFGWKRALGVAAFLALFFATLVHMWRARLRRQRRFEPRASTGSGLTPLATV